MQTAECAVSGEGGVNINFHVLTIPTRVTTPGATARSVRARSECPTELSLSHSNQALLYSTVFHTINPSATGRSSDSARPKDSTEPNSYRHHIATTLQPAGLLSPSALGCVQEGLGLA